MLIDTIRAITAEKTAAHIVPSHALEIEITARQKGLTPEQLHVQAKMLAGAGKIKVGPTINSTYYQLIEQ